MGSGFPRKHWTDAHDWRHRLTFRGNSGSVFTSFTSHEPAPPSLRQAARGQLNKYAPHFFYFPSRLSGFPFLFSPLSSNYICIWKLDYSWQYGRHSRKC